MNRWKVLLISAAAAFIGAKSAAAQSIRLLPENPHYLQYRGQPTVLVTSGEHYGSVLNPDFNYVSYLETLERDGLNFTRLKAFATEADRRGVVIEVTLFSDYYGTKQSPLFAANNVNGVGDVASEAMNTLANGNALTQQERVISLNETGFAGHDDATYRRQAWRFLLAGGGAFNNLDYSFTVGHEDGTAQNEAPGSGSVALRRQLGFLRKFLQAAPLAALHPDCATVVHAPDA